MRRTRMAVCICDIRRVAKEEFHDIAGVVV